VFFCVLCGLFIFHHRGHRGTERDRIQSTSPQYRKPFKNEVVFLPVMESTVEFNFNDLDKWCAKFLYVAYFEAI
jgi:hypothetical protein